MYLGKAEVFHSLSSFRHDNHFSLCKTLTPTACDGWRCAVYGFSRCRRCLFCLQLGKIFGFEASQLGCQELSLHIEQRFRFLWPNLESKKQKKEQYFISGLTVLLRVTSYLVWRKRKRFLSFSKYKNILRTARLDQNKKER